MPNDGNQNPPSNQAQYEEIEQFIEMLEKAKRKMSLLQRADLDGVIVRLNDELIALDKAQLKDSNAEYAALTSEIKSAQSEFDALDQEIKDIIKVAETTAQVFDGLTKLTGFLARVAI